MLKLVIKEKQTSLELIIVKIVEAVLTVIPVHLF